MIKISNKVLYAIVFGLLMLASLDAIFRETVSYKLVIVYAVILSLLPYVSHNVKIEKKLALPFTVLLTSLVLVSMGQYVYAFHNYEWLWLGTLFMCSGIAAAFVYNVKENEEKDAACSGPAECLIVAGIVIIAFALRFYDLQGLPHGVWYDEAMNGNEASNIMNGNLPGVFIGRYTNMPAMFFYIGAFFTKIFGHGIVSVRMIPALLGSLSVLAFYFLCRALFKDITLAAAGAFILCVTRWHITFSRVAFLGMQTLFLELITLYFYARMLEKKKAGSAVMAGVSMGLNLYTYSSADFVPVIIVCHLVLRSVLDGGKFIRENIRNAAFMSAAMIAVGLPLIIFAVTKPQVFFSRAHDLTIMSDIKSTHSLKPLIQSVREHLLMFNFEGDYNGRHNLYKRPMLDAVTGVLFVVGTFIAFFKKRYSLVILWLFVTLGAGFLTISVEAPQAYRILCIIPAVVVMAVIAIKEIRHMLLALNGSKRYFYVFLVVLLSSIAFINLKQYYFEYPADGATFASFSPEANTIAGAILNNGDNYCVFVTRADKIYPFYAEEQRAICGYLIQGKVLYRMISVDNRIDPAEMQNKKGALLILRPSDTDEIAAVNRSFPKSKKEVYANPHTDEVMFMCYYIEAGMIGNKTGFLHY